MKEEYVEESYVGMVEGTFKTCASFAGVIHATYLAGESLTKETAVEELQSLYPTFKDLPMFVVLLTNGVVAFSPQHPDFASRVAWFNVADKSQITADGLCIKQPGAVGLWSLTERQAESCTDLPFEAIVPEGGVECFARIFKRDFFAAAGEAIEISYSPKFKTVSVVVPSCLLVEFNIGTFAS